MLAIAKRIARDAARHIERAFRDLSRVAVYEKSPADYVTSVDLEVERRIIEQLQYHYPQHSILSEERGALPGDDEWQWIIDPLDGTGNFVHGIPHFAVSIACLRNARPEYAVILDVIRDEEFSASRGGGALLNNHRIRVSAQQGLPGALVSGGSLDSTRNSGHGDATLRGLALTVAQSATLRRSGSATLDMAYVAAGRYDAMWDIGLKNGTSPPESCWYKRRVAYSATRGVTHNLWRPVPCSAAHQLATVACWLSRAPSTARLQRSKRMAITEYHSPPQYTLQ